MDDDSGPEIKDQSISQEFDDACDVYMGLENSLDDPNSEIYQDRLHKTITTLENLTRKVNSLGLFSSNESADEIPPSHLKFLLLPYMLGRLWQRSTKESRLHLCELSDTYFRAFFSRCREYELTTIPLPAESEEGEEASPKLTALQARTLKIERRKKMKILEEKIVELKQGKASSRYDEEDEKEFYMAMINQAIMQTEDELNSIALEKRLISYDKKVKSGEVQPAKSTPRPSSSSFILTKNDVQKRVFGAGYPSLPVLTVEEYYKQRMKDGTWKPPESSASTKGSAVVTEEQEAEAREKLEENDDEEKRLREKAMDEFKDDHRRGFGNRHNRS